MRSVSTRTRILLDHPVDVDGVHHPELRVRRAKPKDLGALPAGSANLFLGVSVAARLCGVPPAVIFALDPSDAERVGAEVDRQISRIL